MVAMVGACLIEESVLAGGTNLQRVDQIPQEICPPPTHPNQISRGRIIFPTKFVPLDQLS